MKAALLPLILLMAACGRSAPAPQEKSSAELSREIETLSVPHPPAENHAPAFLLQLVPHADVLAFAGDRPACLLFGQKGLLFVSNGFDGLARSGDSPIRMKADAPVGPTGGFFTSPAGNLSIGRTGQYSAGAEPYVPAWTVQASVRGANGAPPQLFNARWTCRKRLSPELLSNGP